MVAIIRLHIMGHETPTPTPAEDHTYHAMNKILRASEHTLTSQ
jgi:hypothetical protein